MTEPAVVEVSVHVAAAPETVFRYFTDPVRFVRWMGERAVLEPVPGGRYRVSTRGGVEAAGEFLEVHPPHRVVFTWGWTEGAVPPGSTRVEISLEPEDGGTRVVLRHHDLPDQEQRDQHRSGWLLYVDRLAVAVTGGDPGPDPNA